MEWDKKVYQRADTTDDGRSMDDGRWTGLAAWARRKGRRRAEVKSTLSSEQSGKGRNAFPRFRHGRGGSHALRSSSYSRRISIPSNNQEQFTYPAIMSLESPLPALAAFSESLTTLGQTLDPLLKQSLDQIVAKLEEGSSHTAESSSNGLEGRLDAAKLQVSIAYVLLDLVWCECLDMGYLVHLESSADPPLSAYTDHQSS